MTINATTGSAVTQTAADTAQAKAAALADGLRQLASFVDANPELAAEHLDCLTSFLVPTLASETREVMAQFIRAGLAAGAEVTKDLSGPTWARVLVTFGPIKLDVYGNRANVCERVVVGTEEVEEEVPDPDALAAVPKVKVTKQVEKVEWRCTPLLAGGDR